MRRTAFNWSIPIPSVERHRLVIKPLPCQKPVDYVRVGNLRCRRYMCNCENTVAPNCMLADEDELTGDDVSLRPPREFPVEFGRDLLVA